jgi:hypothetical protein
MHETDDRHRPNIDAEGWPQDGFSDDLGHGREPVDTRGGGEANRPLAHHEALPSELADVSDDARDRLTILVPGTRLEAGGTYVDLDDLASGPFTGRDADVVPDGRRIVSKKAIDFELWNRIQAAAVAARGG